MSNEVIKVKLPKWTGNGAEIKKRRIALGVNQGDFWNRLGCTQSGGSRYENAETAEAREVPTQVQMLLTIAYGTEQQKQAVIDSLAVKKTDDDEL